MNFKEEYMKSVLVLKFRNPILGTQIMRRMEIELEEYHVQRQL
jgi:hypothetical protein